MGSCCSSRLPGLPNVDDVDSIWAGFPEVWLHVDLQVLGADMTLG